MNTMRTLLLLSAALLATAAQAQSVALGGQIGTQKAVLVIDGRLATVPVGGSVDGVRLVSLGAGQAEVEVGGARRTLVLGAGATRLQADARHAPSAGAEIVLTANGDGHFFTAGKINGGNVSFLVDTGATVVSIGQADADRLGLNYKNGAKGFANTANGRIPVTSVMLNSLRIGEVELANVEAVVIPSQMPHVLLGNSFLTRFQMRRENDTMRLEKRPN
jgi:aspartyl protease family protein